jgi:hypothetical protein
MANAENDQLSHTIKQRKLARAADKILARNGFFSKPDDSDEPVLVDADSIGQHGRLRPTWTGRP